MGFKLILFLLNWKKKFFASAQKQGDQNLERVYFTSEEFKEKANDEF